MKTAIVHDWLTVLGGADLVVRIIHDIFPSAPIFTFVYNPDNMPDSFREIDIRTSFVQKLPFAKTRYRSYLPLFPVAVEQFDLSEFDLVISSSHCCAHGALSHAEALHLCYCYTPMRYAWDLYHSYAQSLGKLSRIAAAPLLSFIRHWDFAAAQRVDKFVAISRAVRTRIRKRYRREADIIHPPVDTDSFRPVHPDDVDDYFFIMSRHVPYKKVDLAIRAFNTLKLPLVVAGDGPQTGYLKSIAGPTVKMLGRVPDSEARRLMARCKAFIFPQEEDFGLTPVEAQAAGRPVIAYGKAGALDTVIDGVTGTFFHEQTPEALADTVASFRAEDFDPRTARRNAESFSIPEFKKAFERFARDSYARRNDDQEQPLLAADR
jgi:glycosyltransferase involved in cell wall biosynthesis